MWLSTQLNLCSTKHIFENINRYCKKYSIDKITLSLYVINDKQNKTASECVLNFRKRQIFTDAEEVEVTKYLTTASKMTPKDCRSLAYLYAKENHKEYFSALAYKGRSVKRLATRFYDQKQQLSNRTLQATSLATLATLFNMRRNFFGTENYLWTRTSWSRTHI